MGERRKGRIKREREGEGGEDGKKGEGEEKTGEKERGEEKTGKKVRNEKAKKENEDGERGERRVRGKRQKGKV